MRGGVGKGEPSPPAEFFAGNYKNWILIDGNGDGSPGPNEAVGPQSPGEHGIAIKSTVGAGRLSFAKDNEYKENEGKEN